MKKKIRLLLAIALLPMLSFGQVNNGSVKGKIFNEQGEPLPYANVYLDLGENSRGTASDFEGRYHMLEIPPGIYNLRFTYAGAPPVYLTNVEVRPNEITIAQSVSIIENDTLDPVIIIAEEPLIRPDEPSKIFVNYESIKNNPNLRNPGLLIQSLSSDIKGSEDGSELYFRGARKDASLYIIDGVKTDSPTVVPGIAIGSVTLYTGGIPAKYGDLTGGVVIMETKSYFDLYNTWKASTF